MARGEKWLAKIIGHRLVGWPSTCDMTGLPSSPQQLLDLLKKLTSSELDEILERISEASFQCQQCESHYWMWDECEFIEDESYCCECWDMFRWEQNERVNAGHEACDCKACSRLLSPKKRKVTKVKDDE
jgi:hypothetical protein